MVKINNQVQPGVVGKPTGKLASKKAEGKSAGATGWLVKPFDPKKLVDVVNRVLG